ncbi:MAG: DJ-1/PfpI/YhbO family deglycase/protease [Alphaproteobacteria bacterium]|nr:DJ-1/PfpI/YhbO family deglycase/protease [Alphaproteobacteria bacterium]
MSDIKNARILILATDGFERSELLYPRDELRKAGATVHVAAPEAGSIKAWQKGDWADTVPVDKALDAVDAGDYEAIVLPGGVINPDHLRRNEKAVGLVREFARQGKVVAAICHGPWMLVEAGLLKDRAVTSYWSIRTDVENAGGRWRDEEVVVDKGIVTSRSPDDLPAFVRKVVEEVREGVHARA